MFGQSSWSLRSPNVLSPRRGTGMMHASSSRLFLCVGLHLPISVCSPARADGVFVHAIRIPRWEEFTWRWYQAVWQNQPIQEALLVKRWVTIPAVLIATAIGTMTALALYREPASLAKTCCQSLLYIPLIMPSLVIGIALLLFFVAINLSLGVLTILLAHVAFSIPLTTLVILARMQAASTPILEEAAMDLSEPTSGLPSGASPCRCSDLA